MISSWKIATAALALIGVTAVTTGATTAYFMRPDSGPTLAPTSAAAEPLPPAPRAPTVRYVAARSAPVAVAPRPAARVVRTAAPAAADCVTTGDRVWRIAKPGAIGGLL